MEPIRRFEFTVEVFARESDGDDVMNASLADVVYLINDGPCIGDYRLVKNEVVDPAQVEAEMIRIGNDGTFFDDFDDDYGIDETG